NRGHILRLVPLAAYTRAGSGAHGRVDGARAGGGLVWLAGGAASGEAASHSGGFVCGPRTDPHGTLCYRAASGVCVAVYHDAGDRAAFRAVAVIAAEHRTLYRGDGDSDSRGGGPAAGALRRRV